MKQFSTGIVLATLVLGLSFTASVQANPDLTIKNLPLQSSVVPSRGVSVPFVQAEISSDKDLIIKEIVIKQTGLSSNDDVDSVRAEVGVNRSPRASINNDGVGRIQFVRGVDLYAGQPQTLTITANLTLTSGRTIGFDLVDIVTEEQTSATAFSQSRTTRRSLFNREVNDSNTGAVMRKASTAALDFDSLSVREKLAWLRKRKQQTTVLTTRSETKRSQARASGRSLIESRRTGVTSAQFSDTESNRFSGRSRSLDNFIANTAIRNSIVQTETLDTGFDLPPSNLEKVIEFDLVNTEGGARRVNNLYFKNSTGEDLAPFFKGFELRNRKGVKIAYSEAIDGDRARFYFDSGYRLQVNNSGSHTLWAVPKKAVTAAEVSLEIEGAD